MGSSSVKGERRHERTASPTHVKPRRDLTRPPSVNARDHDFYLLARLPRRRGSQVSGSVVSRETLQPDTRRAVMNESLVKRWIRLQSGPYGTELVRAKLAPYLIDLACGSKPFRKQRAKVIPLAHGRVLESGLAPA